MRPVPGMADGRRASIIDDAATTTPTAPMSCFITTEAALDASHDDSEEAHFRPSLSRRKRSLESTYRATRSQLPSPAPTGDSITSLSSSALESDFDLATHPDQSPYIAPHISAGLSRPTSAISTSSNRQLNHGLSPRRRGRSAAPSSDEFSHREHAPQLIMPSLAVPQRRPFSEAGKTVGKLKVLLAGPPGIGKASLIQAIAHTCDHIVHLDPVTLSPNSDFSEMWASTRPRPWWQGDSDLSNSRRRRRSSTGEILDRNLCFVIRSAFQHSPSHLAENEYVDSLLSLLLERPMEDSDLWTVLSNGGGSLVDAVLYMVPHTGLEMRDIELIKSLQDKTNIIPLLARADELDRDLVSSAKERIRQQIQEQGLDCFSFTTPETDEEETDVFAVSSATQTDYDVMDASVLMNSGYVQPLITTDLPQLLEHLFSQDGSAWLRHSTASKCVQWRRDNDIRFGIHMALTHRDPSKCALSPVLTVNPFAQRWHWNRIEISNWAQGLRNSLETERLRCVAQHRMASETHRRQRLQDLVRKRGNDSSKQTKIEPANRVHQDPLGLLNLGSQLRINGHLALELLSSLGMMGCMTAWVVGPNWAFHRGLRQLSREFLGWALVV